MQQTPQTRANRAPAMPGLNRMVPSITVAIPACWAEVKHIHLLGWIILIIKLMAFRVTMEANHGAHW